jgi:hypothetical protein
MKWKMYFVDKDVENKSTPHCRSPHDCGILCSLLLDAELLVGSRVDMNTVYMQNEVMPCS